jgi:hypothetical protein
MYLQAQISPPKVPSPEEAEDVGPTTIREYPKGAKIEQ